MASCAMATLALRLHTAVECTGQTKPRSLAARSLHDRSRAHQYWPKVRVDSDSQLSQLRITNDRTDITAEVCAALGNSDSNTTKYSLMAQKLEM